MIRDRERGVEGPSWAVEGGGKVSQQAGSGGRQLGSGSSQGQGSSSCSMTVGPASWGQDARAAFFGLRRTNAPGVRLWLCCGASITRRRVSAERRLQTEGCKQEGGEWYSGMRLAYRSG